MVLPQQADTLAIIDLDELRKAGIWGVILDLDNTLVSEDDRWVSPGAERWVAQAKSAGFKLFILSNGKRKYRVKTWSERLGVPAISPAYKPFPPSFRKVLEKMQLQPNQVVVIGDSLHTDGVGSGLVGCPWIQVASLPHPPRWWEKLVGRWVQIPYPAELELWELE